jgi:hypothetical protein
VCPTGKGKDFRGYDWFANGTADTSVNGTKSVDVIEKLATDYLDQRSKSPEDVSRLDCVLTAAYFQAAVRNQREQLPQLFCTRFLRSHALPLLCASSAHCAPTL